MIKRNLRYTSNVSSFKHYRVSNLIILLFDVRSFIIFTRVLPINKRPKFRLLMKINDSTVNILRNSLLRRPKLLRNCGEYNVYTQSLKLKRCSEKTKYLFKLSSSKNCSWQQTNVSILNFKTIAIGKTNLHSTIFIIC